MNPELPPSIYQVVALNGYTEVRNVSGQGWCGLLKFTFTWAIVVNLTPDCYERRYCFEQQADAAQSLSAWSGHEHPPGPWIKCKGASIDLLNPMLTTI